MGCDIEACGGLAGLTEPMFVCEGFAGLHVWEKRKASLQAAQKGCPVRPERCENEAGGLFQQPATFWLYRYLNADAASRARHGQVRGPGCSVAWSWASAYEDK